MKMVTCSCIIKKYWCLALTALVYFWTLIQWFASGDDMDVLWSSIFNYCLLFPICGIILGIHYGRRQSSWKWILPLCAFLGVMIHDILVGYALFGKVEFDPGQIQMYLVTAVPCAAAEIITHIIVSIKRKRIKE